MRPVDLRSDTVTRPTDAMRRAMAEAEVGDDVFGDDPTVHRLEARVAELLGKEAALFVPSGTMANQIALSLHGGPGTEVLVHEGAHVFNYEAGAPAALWGITVRPLPGAFGRIDPAHITAALHPVNEHFAPVTAVAFENTHNRAGGAVWPQEILDEAMGVAHGHGLAVHLDGARLWNAAASTGLEPSRIARDADTVSVCFSKGLGAPVGSCLAGRAAHVERARFVRKRLGGGMRQVGILAAAALHAVEHHRERLADDHARALRLAGALGDLPGVEVLPVQSNIVIADVAGAGRTSESVAEGLEAEGVRVVAFGPTRFRMVTHLDVDDAAIDRACAALTAVLGGAA